MSLWSTVRDTALTRWDALADQQLGAKWSRLTNTRNLNDFGYDEFGFNPAFVKRMLPAVHAIYRYWFRVSTYGQEHIPAGRVLFVANHSGQLPFDGMMIAAACIFDADPPRILRSMVETWVATLPFVSMFMARCGQIVGIPSNCRKLLDADEAILVFPEGARGISKTIDRAYQLEEFGYGFMRLALETRCPIVPVALVGAEEQAPSLYNAKFIARLVGAPSFPITPTFPWLLPIGALPYPVKYHIHFGAPMQFEGDPSEDDSVIGDKVEQVRSRIQHMLDKGVCARKGIFR